MARFTFDVLLVLIAVKSAPSQTPDERVSASAPAVPTVPVVIGKPYTARLVIEHMQRSEDGAKSPGAKFQARIYRDKEGRTREERFPPMNANTSDSHAFDEPMSIRILDPVAGFAY